MTPPKPFTMSVYYTQQFWTHVERTDGCWLWLLATVKGYGVFSIRINGKTRMVKAHNAAWVATYGHMPTGLEPDHTCFNRRCVNPDHIEWVTSKENNKRKRAYESVLHNCLMMVSDGVYCGNPVSWHIEKSASTKARVRVYSTYCPQHGSLTINMNESILE